MTKKIISRKSFIKKGLVGSLAAGTVLSACETETALGPNIITNKKYRWTLVTTWPPNFPVLGEGCNQLAQWVNEMSGGQMEIRVFGSGELIPAFEVFEAVSSGTAELGHSASYYWAGKFPAAQYFCAVPFGMNAQQINAWLFHGGGLDLWRKYYTDFDLIPFIAGNTGVQMAGWFNKEINDISDFKGLKMRIPGLGGKILQEAGSAVQSTPASEIYTNLERGVIDASEWIGPYHDYKMGFHQIAKYYYAPGWHEPGPALELMVNKTKFEELPLHLQRIIEAAAFRFNMNSLSEFEAQNAIYIKKIQEETDVSVRRLSPEIIDGLKEITLDTIASMTAKDAPSKEVYASFSSFQSKIQDWATWTEQPFYNLMSG